MDYRAKLSFTGEIFETDNLRLLYHIVRRELRGYLIDFKYYTFESVTIIAGKCNDDFTFTPDHVVCSVYGHGIDNTVSVNVTR